MSDGVRTPAEPGQTAGNTGTQVENVRLTPFEERVIAFFTDAAGVLGVPKSVAMIYGVLFGSPQPLSFSEIEQKLGISKGSVSQGLRALRALGAVGVVQGGGEEHMADDGNHRGPATARYAPVVELRRLLARLVADKVQPQLKSAGQKIAALADVLPASTADAKVLELRLKHLRAWQRRSRELLPILKTFLR